jgi:hypothetical protein
VVAGASILLTRLDTANPPKKGALRSIKQNLSLKHILVLRNKTALIYLITLVIDFSKIEQKDLSLYHVYTAYLSKGWSILALIIVPEDIERVLTTETRFRTSERQ